MKTLFITLVVIALMVTLVFGAKKNNTVAEKHSAPSSETKNLNTNHTVQDSKNKTDQADKNSNHKGNHTVKDSLHKDNHTVKNPHHKGNHTVKDSLHKGNHTVKNTHPKINHTSNHKINHTVQGSQHHKVQGSHHKINHTAHHKSNRTMPGPHNGTRHGSRIALRESTDAVISLGDPRALQAARFAVDRQVGRAVPEASGRGRVSVVQQSVAGIASSVTVFSPKMQSYIIYDMEFSIKLDFGVSKNYKIVTQREYNCNVQVKSKDGYYSVIRSLHCRRTGSSSSIVVSSYKPTFQKVLGRLMNSFSGWNYMF